MELMTSEVVNAPPGLDIAESVAKISNGTDHREFSWPKYFLFVQDIQLKIKSTKTTLRSVVSQLCADSNWCYYSCLHTA